MSDQLRNSKAKTSEDTDKSTCSVEFSDGHSPCNSPDGPQLDLFGQALAPANPSRSRAKEKAKQTNGTSGLRCFGSSESVALTRFLGSKLRAMMGCGGSMEYVLTWRKKVTPSGRLIYALRGRARKPKDGLCMAIRVIGSQSSLELPIFGSGCSGWPTPVANDDNKTPEAHLAMKKRMGERDGTGANRTTITSLAVMAQLAGWPTPDHSHHGSYNDPEKSLARITSHLNGGPKRTANLDDVANLAGWQSPTAGDAKSRTYQYDNHDKTKPRLSNLGLVAGFPSGIHSTSSPAETEKRGVLNPEHSRWLMGFPAEWGCSGASAMQLCRKSRRRS